MTETKKQVPQVQQKQLPAAERFTNLVMKEFKSSSISIEGMDDKHKRLCQSYFVKLDGILKAAEQKRDDKKNSLQYDWHNVNLEQLAQDVITFTAVGLDPALDNHISMIPYPNPKTGKYDIGFLPGYRGIEIKAKKYGINVPVDCIVELVYSKDKFKPIKKSAVNEIETYEFTIAENAFDRGTIVGGFSYLVFEDQKKNRLKIWTEAEILKRKPKHGPVEFWGGEKAIWENGKKTGKTETVEGWKEEMYFKTMYKEAYNSITIDGDKIDQSFIRMEQIENSLQAEFQQELPAANTHELPELKPEPVKTGAHQPIVDNTTNLPKGETEKAPFEQ